MAREDGRLAQAWTLCIPHYCTYAHACPVKALRQRYVLRRDCFRYQPQWQRPLPQLSGFARELLVELRTEAVREGASQPTAPAPAAG